MLAVLGRYCREPQKFKTLYFGDKHFARKHVYTLRKHVETLQSNALDGVILCSFALCCCPLPNEDIIGFIEQIEVGQKPDTILVIHKHDCPFSRNHSGNIIPLSWKEQTEGTGQLKDEYRYPIGISVLSFDRPGLFHEILEVFSKNKIDIQTVSTNRLSMWLDDEMDRTVAIIELGTRLLSLNGYNKIREEILKKDDGPIDVYRQPYPPRYSAAWRLTMRD